MINQLEAKNKQLNNLIDHYYGINDDKIFDIWDKINETYIEILLLSNKCKTDYERNRCERIINHFSGQFERLYNQKWIKRLEIKDKLFKDCLLNNVSFKYAKINNCRFENCLLNNADFESAILDNTIFNECNLYEAKFSGGQLTKSDFRICIMDRVYMRETSNHNINFYFSPKDNPKTCFSIDFSQSDLVECFFHNAILNNCSFLSTNIKRCEFTALTLNRINFSFSEIEDTKFVGFYADHSIFYGTELTNCYWKLSKISFSTFSRSNLQNSSIHTGDFINCSFSHCSLKDFSLMNESTMEGCFLSYTILEGSGLSDAFIKMLKSQSGKIFPIPEEKNKNYLEAKDVYQRLSNYFQSLNNNEMAIRLHIKAQDMSYKLSCEKLRKCCFNQGKSVLLNSIKGIQCVIENVFSILANRLHKGLSNYGGSPYRIFLSSLIIIILFGVLFYFDAKAFNYVVDCQNKFPLLDYIYISATNFTTLGIQNAEPNNGFSKVLVIFEAVIGTFIMAYFVVVWARKHMR